MVQVNKELNSKEVDLIENLFISVGASEVAAKAAVKALGHILDVDFYEDDPMQPGIRYTACAECFYYESGICQKYGGTANPNTTGNDCFRDLECQRSYALYYGDEYFTGPVTNADENGNYNDDFDELEECELAAAAKRLKPDLYEEHASDTSYDQDLWNVRY